MARTKLLSPFFAVCFLLSCIIINNKVFADELLAGLDFFVREEYDSSLNSFNKVLKSNVNNSKALFYRALVYNKKGDPVKALLDLENILDIDSTFRWKEENLFAVAEYNYTGKKDHIKAISIFNLFIAKFPKSENTPRAYIEIADIYRLHKDFDNALLNYKNVMELFSEGKSNNDKRAVAIASQAMKFIEENSDYDREPLRLFSDLNSGNDVVKKIQMGRDILEKYPDCKLADDIQFKIAKLYSVEGLNDFDQATVEYKKLIEKYPNSPYVVSAKNSILGIEEKFDTTTGKLNGSFH